MIQGNQPAQGALARGRANSRALLYGRYFLLRTPEQALVYHDLGNRFLCFFPNGKEGNPRVIRINPSYSSKEALDKKYSWEAANNLAVAIFFQGKPKEAAAYLNQVETEDTNDIVQQKPKGDEWFPTWASLRTKAHPDRSSPTCQKRG